MFYTQYPNKTTGCVCRKLRGYGGVEPVETNAEKASIMTDAFWFFWLWLQRAAESFG